MNPLHARYYADRSLHRRADVLDNVRLARDTFRLRIACPEMAARIVPGQFLMLRLADLDDPLIGRPLALYDTAHAGRADRAATAVPPGRRDPGPPGPVDAIDVVYLVKGKLTSRLQHFAAGDAVEVWGPLGNGFAPTPTEHLVMVAGGIGQTPFLALAREALGQATYGEPARPRGWARRVTFCYGARSADLLAGLDDFRRAGAEVRVATDDGTAGHHGLVTELLEDTASASPAPSRIVCCGPEPMMEATARLAARFAIPCEVSLETPMACGVGICFSCVAKVRDNGGRWDYRRTCVEGPVFDAALIEW